MDFNGSITENLHMTAATGKLPLKNLFSKFVIDTDRHTADQIVRWRRIYETRDTHSDALNTPLLGCDKLGFFERDSQMLFDILHVSRDEFKRAIRQSSIPNSFRVASDDFNLFVVWVAHNYFISKLPQSAKDQVCQSLFFMLVVKFFSGLVRHYYPHGANKGVMEATIDSLSEKFDIKQKATSTWKLIIDKRADEMVDQHGIHSATIKTFTPDKKVIYVITDLQTRIRTKVRLITNVYYEMVKAGREVRESGMVTNDAEGEKIIKELNNSFDGMVTALSNIVLNTQQFLRTDYIMIVCKLVPNVRVDMMRNMLMQFSAHATIQYQKKRGDDMSKDGKLFEGYHILIQNMIQRLSRDAIMKKVNMNSRLEILKNAMDVIRSSRVNDPIIAMIKESLGKFVIGTRLSQRDATNASLRIAFVAYIILLSFDCN